jgi:hypothetical protein
MPRQALSLMPMGLDPAISFRACRARWKAMTWWASKAESLKFGRLVLLTVPLIVPARLGALPRFAR